MHNDDTPASPCAAALAAMERTGELPIYGVRDALHPQYVTPRRELNSTDLACSILTFFGYTYPASRAIGSDHKVDSLVSIIGKWRETEVPGGEADIRSAALNQAIETCKLELVDSAATNAPEDIAYNVAIGHCIEAIEGLLSPSHAKVQGAAPTDAQLIEAVDAVYPIPDSPHASVKTRANDNRVAFLRGYRAALAAPVAQATSGESSERAPAEEKVICQSLGALLIAGHRPTKTAEVGSIDTPEFLGRVIAAAAAAMNDDTSGEWDRFIAYITNFFASAPATGEQA